MERRAIIVRGIVQGVGFRPFVFRLAARWALGGFVKNQTGAVYIEAEGEPAALDAFVSELTNYPPPLAHIESISWQPRAPCGAQEFCIVASESTKHARVFVSPDVATCADCLRELFDPAERRHRYPFLNCTNCGPRLTIITGAPYDRARTTMAAFRMCAACRAEYDNPADRRFHAQPIACPACGPRLQLVDGAGQEIPGGDPLAQFVAQIRAGRIGALKGLGGYHLVCDATNALAVAQLRRRKQRDEKPFALMVADAAAASRLCDLSPAEQALLEGPARPIVLLRRRPGTFIAEEVAPHHPHLGILLPYTPLHHLLLHDVAGPLVMTSGNRTDEPIAHDDRDAFERLRGIADVFLTHDRAINVRCDDSVTRVVDGVEQPLRRSRGYAPQPIPLPCVCPEPILAVGGQLKVTFALGRERQAFLSQHMGDLDHYEALAAFLKDVPLFEELFETQPLVIAHDAHPDYATTRYAWERGQRAGVRLVSVQHHHAHMASCMAENGLDERVIGVTFDGTGYGGDGAIWGGEFLVGDLARFERAAHLRYVGMPGGEQAIREPWRMALAHVLDANVSTAALETRLLPAQRRTVEKMLQRGLQTPLTSSMGRLFDAVASLIGVRDRVSYEGQAAVELEWLATASEPARRYPFALVHDDAGAPLVIDTRPLIRAVAEDVARGEKPAVMARRFHATIPDMIIEVCRILRSSTRVDAVVLSGGVFLNALLTAEATGRLRHDGFRVYRHRLVPPSDGGLSLGQLAVAAAQSQRRGQGDSAHVSRDTRQGDGNLS